MSGRRSLSPTAMLAAAAVFLAVLTGTSVWAIREFVVQPKQTILLPADVLQQMQQAARPAATPLTNTGNGGGGGGQPTFRGAVVDAQTHLPIPTFVVRLGYQYPGNQPYFNNMPPQTFHGGQYVFTSRFSVGGNANYLVRVEADGHLPTVSQPMRKSGTADFELPPGKDITGIVVDAAGAPVARATVFVGVAGLDSYIDPTGIASSGRNSSSTVTGHDGRFHLPPEAGQVMLAAATNKGYGQITLNDPAGDCKIALAPWGRIQGQLIIAGKPAANQQVWAQSISQNSDAQISSGSSTQTDANGKFQFARVVPGQIQMGRYLKIQMGNRGYMMQETQTEQVAIAVGQTLTAKIGGSGRPVTGRLILIPSQGSFKNLIVQGQVTGTELPQLPPQMPANVKAGSSTGRDFWMQIFSLTAAGRQWAQTHPTGPQLSHQYAIELVGDKGKFRIDDVIPGDYRIFCYVRPAQGGGRLFGPEQVEFSVPPIPGGGYSDQPLAIPDITLKTR